MPLEIIRNDITKMKVDAIVNAANSSLQQGGGVCGAIFSAAGADALQAECNSIGSCGVGAAVITDGYALPAKHIIHTVGPVWQGGMYNEEKLLTSCYTNSLMLANKQGCKSVAFPLISSGIFGYPKDKALQVAISAIGAFILEHDMMVYLVVYDKDAYALSDKLFKSIAAYIDDKYVDSHISPRRNRIEKYEHISPLCYLDRSLDDVMGQLDESFSDMILRLINEKGKKDTEIYKRANIDRKLFSKIRSNQYYQPSKNTAIALAIALELSLDGTRDLIGKAGFALSHSSKSDLIIEYFIDNQNYNIFEINEALFAFDQSMLGA